MEKEANHLRRTRRYVEIVIVIWEKSDPFPLWQTSGKFLLRSHSCGPCIFLSCNPFPVLIPILHFVLMLAHQFIWLFLYSLPVSPAWPWTNEWFNWLQEEEILKEFSLLMPLFSLLFSWRKWICLWSWSLLLLFLFSSFHQRLTDCSIYISVSSLSIRHADHIPIVDVDSSPRDLLSLVTVLHSIHRSFPYTLAMHLI